MQNIANLYIYVCCTMTQPFPLIVITYGWSLKKAIHKKSIYIGGQKAMGRWVTGWHWRIHVLGLDQCVIFQAVAGQISFINVLFVEPSFHVICRNKRRWIIFGKSSVNKMRFKMSFLIIISRRWVAIVWSRLRTTRSANLQCISHTESPSVNKYIWYWHLINGWHKTTDDMICGLKMYIQHTWYFMSC